MPLQAPTTPLLPATLGRFSVTRELGRGTTSVVVEARDPSLDRVVAIKLLLKPDDEAKERMRREARALATVSHPNVVQVHEVGEEGESLFIVMERINGVDLKAFLLTDPRPPQTPGALLPVFRDAANGLLALHQAGLVHRDIKPANLLVGKDGRLRLVDCGLVTRRHDVDCELTHTGALVGTPRYMSPEQHERHDVDAKSDQFSLGVVMFETMLGCPPFAGDTYLSLAKNVLAGRIAATSTYPNLHKALARALAVRPADRYSDLSTFVDEVERALSADGKGVATSAPPVRSRVPTWVWVASIVAIGVAVYFARTQGKDSLAQASATPTTSQTAPVVMAAVSSSATAVPEANVEPPNTTPPPPSVPASLSGGPTARATAVSRPKPSAAPPVTGDLDRLRKQMDLAE